VGPSRQTAAGAARLSLHLCRPGWSLPKPESVHGEDFAGGLAASGPAGTAVIPGCFHAGGIQNRRGTGSLVDDLQVRNLKLVPVDPLVFAFEAKHRPIAVE